MKIWMRADVLRQSYARTPFYGIGPCRAGQRRIF